MQHLHSQSYSDRISAHRERVEYWSKKGTLLAWARFGVALLILTFIYLGSTQHPLWFWGTGLFTAVFLLLVRIHYSQQHKKRFAETLLQINNEELLFLEDDQVYFENGSRYQNPKHPYSYDLDVFGPHSLFQYLNRTKTVRGADSLAHSLLHRLPENQLVNRQEAIEELSSSTEWRYDFQANAALAEDSEPLVNQIFNWRNEQSVFPTHLNYLRFILPVCGASLTAAYFTSNKMMFLYLAVVVFSLNMRMLATIKKQITREISIAEKINRTLLGYGVLMKSIENQEWKSNHLKQLATSLQTDGTTASQQLKQLSGIFASLESIENGFGMIVFNGTVQYHVHIYRQLVNWKSAYAAKVGDWIEVISELELLISFANLLYNNPDFCFPVINNNRSIQFEELGHPLIAAHKRVSNTVDFSQRSFIILTGSNMSGKSTFLRTLGVNFILANTGAPICAKTASIHAMDMLVSMRLSDSLSDSESYFFAEVKRLKEIVESLEEKDCFVLLDEILRGTNSDDKRSGTVAVVKKMVERKAIGAIATHDLEVCETTAQHPETLTNKCFEVEIRDNDLYFDYRLRDGICQNKSATFLMKKMGVIS